MRNLSATAIAAMQTRLGTEPIVIIEIEWNLEASTTRASYADRDVGNIPGKIVEVSALDNVISIDQNEDTAEMDIKLDDTDGSIKAIMDQFDIHKRDVWVYHWFEGMPLDDKFLLFRGKISSPVSWVEGDQTVSFSVVTQIEDKEAGFSPEEGQFPFIPRDMVGRVWPSIFGTGIDVPAVQCNKAVTGTTLCPVGILSGVSEHLNAPYGAKPPNTMLAHMTAAHHWNVAAQWQGHDNDVAKDHYDKADAANEQATKAWDQYLRAKQCAIAQRQATVDAALAQGIGCNPVRILGGEDFPRGGITLVIGGAYFTGSFSTAVGEEDMFHISSRSHPPDEEAATRDATDNGSPYCQQDPGVPADIKLQSKIPCTGGESAPVGSMSSGNFKINGECVRRDQAFFIRGPNPEPNPPKNDVLKHFWANSGSQVSIGGDEPITYIVSIVPGTVLQVKAFKNFHGLSVLTHVPTDLYEVREITYGTISTVQVVVNKALSTITDQEWDDDLYVTFQSDVGPNICDILKYLIDTYSEMTYDLVSFDEVQAKLEIFPANFALLERKNIVAVLNEIAFQARCSLRLIDGIFYIRYLAEEPAAVDTITETDIDHNTIVMELTSTENVVTKYTATWRVSYAQKELNKLILRHNVRKYGIQEEEYEYYIYNQPDIIHKVATFWLIRKSNTWKRLKFDTFLQKINLEAFDAITLDFDKPYVANGPVKGILEVADLDTDNQSMTMECWLPVKSGEMEAYDFAWPATVPAEWDFPTQSEIDLGLAGGDNIGANATGDLPIGVYDTLTGEGVIYMGGPNQGMGPQSDRGDPHPSDVDFTPRPVFVDTTHANVESSEQPALWLAMTGINNVDDPFIQMPSLSYNVIYIDQTKIRHTEKTSESDYGTLDQMVVLVEDDGGPGGDNSEGELRVCIADEAHVSGEDPDDEKTPNKQYDFKYDKEGEKWGCQTCFLQAGEDD